MEQTLMLKAFMEEQTTTPLQDFPSPEEDFLAVSLQMFRDQKDLGDKALAQITERELHWSPDAGSNSLAILIQHMSGNMRSRWTEFFTSDLEKPDRNRDTEFEERLLSTAELLERWNEGWQHVFETMSSLTKHDLNRTVTIRKEPHTVIKAIVRQISHYGYHVGQMVYLAKQIRSAEWQTLSIARGKSDAFVPPALKR